MGKKAEKRHQRWLAWNSPSLEECDRLRTKADADGILPENPNYPPMYHPYMSLAQRFAEDDDFREQMTTVRIQAGRVAWTMEVATEADRLWQACKKRKETGAPNLGAETLRE
eukprot:2387471-Pyramimonas_sp.AAC.1